MHNNCLEFIINNKKYNLEDFLKFYSHNNKCINTNEKNIEEQLNGIETTAVESDKSENIIKEKNGKINKSVSQNNNDEENNDNLNSLRKQKRIKRKISIENDEVEQVEQNYQELNKIKNGSWGIKIIKFFIEKKSFFSLPFLNGNIKIYYYFLNY